MSKSEYDAMVKDSEQKDSDDDITKSVKPGEDVGGSVTGEREGSQPKVSGASRDEVAKKQQVVDVGGPSKKRKAAKIVGGEDEDEEKDEEGNAEGGEAKRPKAGTKKTKKKGKPIKLSFGDDDA